jgi:hypothetical protein
MALLTSQLKLPKQIALHQALETGGFVVLPAGMKHYAWSTTETVLQIHGKGPFEIKYVNPADDPRNAKK